MPYRLETFTAPGIREVKKYHTHRLGGVKTRAANYRETEESVKRGNERRAKEKLYRLIVTNFKRDDWRLDLTYKDPPPEPEEAVARVRKFLRKLRSLYKKHGEELKYIYVTEYRGHRIHHHLILSRCQTLTRRDLNALWPYAEFNYRSFRLYDGKAEDGKRLSEYLVKESLESPRERAQKTRWVSSKNLTKPKVTYRTIYSRNWREKPKAPKGWHLEGLMEGWTEEGYPYQFYRLIEDVRRKRHGPYQRKNRKKPPLQVDRQRRDKDTGKPGAATAGAD